MKALILIGFLLLMSAGALAADPIPCRTQNGCLGTGVPPTVGQVPVGQSDGQSQWNDPSGLGVIATDGITLRTLAAYAGDALSLQDLGAVCDGTTDDSAAITTALSKNKRIAIPGTFATICNAPGISNSALIGSILIGPGTIRTSDGKLRGAQVVEINTPPASTVGISTSVVNAFNGDTSRVVRGPIEIHVTGALTAGNPVSPNYLVEPEISADWITGFTSSGVQTSTSGPPFGRTGQVLRLTTGTNAGLGDYVMNWVACTVSGQLAGATTWTGATECGGLAGSMAAGANGAYLQPIGDLDCLDNGFDVSCIGTTMVLKRTNDTAALGNPWIGHFVESNGTKNIDAAYSSTGPMNMTFDCYDSGVSSASPTIPCMVMQAGMRIYGNATGTSTQRLPRNVALGSEYVQYDAVNGWGFYKNGVLQFASGGSGPPIYVLPPSPSAVHCSLWSNAGVVTQVTPCP